MQTPAPVDAAMRATPWWVRAHRALMPDYNRKAAAYWWIAVLAGGSTLALAMRQNLALPAADLLVVLAGVALAMLAGAFPVRIPRCKNAFTAGEIFIFLLLLLLHGPAAAALAAAGEGLLGSWRTSKRWTSRLASPAMAAIAMYGVGAALTAVLGELRAHGQDNAGWMLLAVMVSAVIYFVCTAVLMTAVSHLKRDAWPTAQDLFGNFGWIGFTSAASASVACLLYLSARQSGLGVLLAAAPIIALMLVSLHYYFRQHEVDEAARLSRLEAAEREARLAESHVRDLRASEQRFHSAFSHASIGMALVAFDAQVLQANAALSALLGFARESEVESLSLFELVDSIDAVGLRVNLQRLMDGRSDAFAAELRLRHCAGNDLWAAVHGSLFMPNESERPCLILQIQDVTARREAEADLQHLAYHDSLTGLPNRHRFQQLLSSALQGARSGQGKPFGLMFLDFDRFKLINDSLGHAVGDEFLVAVAQRIQQLLRSGDAVARLGGDEFAIIAADLDSQRYAVGLAERLVFALGQPFKLSGADITSSVSIGITFSGNGDATTSDMLRDADTAMYKAKASGKARYALFDTALHTAVVHRMRLEGDLRRALAAGQISVLYLPLFDLRDGRVTGFEALARWQHAELGLIEPATFIPVAEEAGLMVPLTDFVLGTACRQLGAWQQLGARFESLNMHVNLSGVDVAHPNLVARVNNALAEARLRPRDLTLELTENMLMQRLEGALPALTQLRRAGIGLSFDDFGTGYSSLRLLSSLPVDGLKLDRCFVAELERSASDATIVHSIIMMASSLGKTVIAEGIETAQQLARLKQAGCHLGQGFFLSGPLSPVQVAALLGQQQVAAEQVEP